jgi:hypothetical protein
MSMGREGGDAMTQLLKTLCRPLAWGLLLALLVLLLYAPIAGAAVASRQGSSEPTLVADNGPDNLSKKGGDGGTPPPSPVDEGDPDDYGRPVPDIVIVKVLLAGLFYFMMPR